MRILQINSRYEYASTGRATKELDDTLRKNGVESYVACAEWLPIEKSDSIFKISSYFGRKLHALLSRITGKQGHFSFFATKRLLKYISKIKPDIVHLLNLHANYINFPLLMKFLAKNKIPVVITTHDCWYFTGRCCLFLPNNCYRWLEECGNCPCKENGNKSWFFDTSKAMLKEKKELFSKLDRLAVIGVSDWITKQAEKSFLGSYSNICRCIYDWIDTKKFYPRGGVGLKKYAETNNKFIVIFVAYAITKEKGIFDILEVAKKLPSDIVIVLVGRVSNSISVPDNIKIIPSTNDTDELCEYYSSADVLLNLSHHETFGLVTAEALACGTPAVVYNITACPELIGDGCGYVCEMGDYDSVAKSILEIKERGKNSYSEKCIEYVKKNFDKEKNALKYLELYKEMLI